MVVSIPIDSLDALQQIEGVQRIDKGHKGQKKTDVSRQELTHQVRLYDGRQ